MTINQITAKSDLAKGIQLCRLGRLFAQTDRMAHTITVAVTDDGLPADFTGKSASCWFIRPDEATVYIDATIGSNGVVSVTLPSACYENPGHFSLVIKVFDTDTSCAVFWADGSITRSNTDAVISPSRVVPDLDLLLAEIEHMEQATADCESATEDCESATEDCETAISNANIATSNANSATSACQTQTGLCQTATTNANAATSACQSQTSLCETATSNANSATTACQTQTGLCETATSNANTATSNANSATSAANTAASTANTAASNADTARTACETQTGLCQSATTAANTAAQNANDAADDADTATQNANTATQNTNTAISNAQTATSAANTAATKIENMTVSATTLAEGSSATVSISEVSGHKHISFGIPKGDTGVAENVYANTVPMSSTDATTIAQKFARLHTTKTITISVSDWSSSGTVTKTVSGVTSSNTLIVSPAPSSFETWCESLIRCTAQGTNTMTFTCTVVPTSAVTVNVLIVA